MVGGYDKLSDEAIRDWALALNLGDPESFADIVWNIFEPKTNICPDCEGSGKLGSRECKRCLGQGKVFESVNEKYTKCVHKNILYPKGESFVCPYCGLHMPKYEGRYPQKCPHCETTFEKPKNNKKADEVKYLGSVAQSTSCKEGIMVLGVLNECCYIQIDEGKFAYKWKDHTAKFISEKVNMILDTAPMDILSFILSDLTFIENGIEQAFDTIPEDVDGKVTRCRILEGEEETVSKEMDKFWKSSKGKSIMKEQTKMMAEQDLKEEQKEEMAMRIHQIPLLEINRNDLLEKLLGQYTNEEFLVGSVMLSESADEEKVANLLATLSMEYPHTTAERQKNKQYFIIIY